MTTTRARQAQSKTGRASLRRLVTDGGPILALFVLVVFFSIANHKFVSVTNLRSLADQAAIPLTLGTGMTFVILLGAIDLSLEGNLAATSMLVALLMADQTNSVDLGPWAILIAILMGAAFGLVNGFVNTRFRIPAFMVTLGTWYVGLGIAEILFGLEPPRAEMSARAWGFDRWLGISRIFFVAIGVIAVGYVIQRWTRVGRYAYAIGGAEELTRHSGVNVNRYKIFAFMFAGATFGLAGAMLIARTGVGDIPAAKGFLFTTIAGVVIGGTLLSGGRGGVLHSSVGILIMVVLNNGMNLSGVSQYWQDAIAGFIVVGAVVFTALGARRRMRVVS
jgi:ribose transport system permease protein